MLGIPIGLAVSNIAEWLIHKHVLHERGRVRSSFWSFHWHEHHRNARSNGFLDPDYERSVLAWNAQGKEAFGLVGMALLVTPLFPVAPFFVLTSYYSSYHYYRVHKRAHQDPEWAREHVPWHYDHHMGPNQDCNWCVTHPWFDVVMGTREEYAGTERERADREKREAKTTRLSRSGTS
jgi:sterol desaturase/sphingolipid hydroxylase (fatty acid hydroxylase superfamily)